VADYEDPGWRPLFKELKVYLIPFAGPLLFRRKQRPAVDPLTAFRLIFLGLVGSLLVWGWILLYIVQSDRWWKSDQSTWFLAVVIGLGAGNLIYVQAIRARRLNVEFLERLAASYRGQTFIGIGVAESSALVGFVGTFIMGNYWIYLVGLTFALSELFLVGPTRREIARRQEQIAAQGSPLSLVQALMETLPPGWRKIRREAQ
jgi:hypothetical protein